MMKPRRQPRREAPGQRAQHERERRDAESECYECLREAAVDFDRQQPGAFPGVRDVRRMPHGPTCERA